MLVTSVKIHHCVVKVNDKISLTGQKTNVEVRHNASNCLLVLLRNERQEKCPQ